MLIKMPIFRNRGMSSAGAMPRDCAGAQARNAEGDFFEGDVPAHQHFVDEVV